MHFVRDHIDEFQGELTLENEEGLRALRLQADAQLALTLQAREMEGEEEEKKERGGEDEEEEMRRRVFARVRNSDEDGKLLLPFSRAGKAVMRNVAGGRRRGRGRERKMKEEKERKKRVRLSWSDEEKEKEEEEEEESDDDSDSDDEGVVGHWGGRRGEEEEEEAMEGPTTRSGTTIRYGPTSYPSAAGVDAGIPSWRRGERPGDGGRALSALRPLESEREMEARKARRLQLLVERTAAMRTRLEKGIASLLPAEGVEGESGGEGGGKALPDVVLEGRVLRNYQKMGLSWLLSLHKNQLNGILADEMVGGSLKWRREGGREGGRACLMDDCSPTEFLPSFLPSLPSSHLRGWARRFKSLPSSSTSTSNKASVGLTLSSSLCRC